LLGGDGVADVMRFYCDLGGGMRRTGFPIGAGYSFLPHNFGIFI